MYATAGAVERARWEVMWISKGKVVRKDCKSDFPEALRIYNLARDAGKNGVTLRCKNMAFAPPVKYADREVVEIIHKGKRRKAKRIVVPHRYADGGMVEMNLKGAFWCPYCIAFRRFKKRNGFKLGGTIQVDEPAMYCPMCKVSHRDSNVLKYNPYAKRYLTMRRTRSDKGRSRD